MSGRSYVGSVALLVLALGVGFVGSAGADPDARDSIRRRPDPLRVVMRRLLIEAGARPLRNRDFPEHEKAKVALGEALFFDKEISGNRDVSCATCHHPLAGTGDGLSLPVGVGGAGISVTREMGRERVRVPRNAPDIWNRAAFPSMFWDSRVAADPDDPTRFDSPAGPALPPGLESALAVQAMFPVTSPDEMRGQPGENEIADAGSDAEVWRLLMKRLLAIGGYQRLFARAYPGVAPGSLGFQHAANAIAAFEGTAWKATGAPFNRYLLGETEALSPAATRGAFLFYGRAGCSGCHSGALLSDFEHHAIAMPQIGPGKGDGPDGDEDFGRARESGSSLDMYRFRTPSLWNTALTGPWGHSGAYGTLEAVVRHHLDPVASLERYDGTQVELPPGPPDLDPLSVMKSPMKRASIAAANQLEPVRLSRNDRNDLLAFLRALTDPDSIDVRADVPDSVPSGLPIAD